MVYKCSVCGYVFDEEAEGKKLENLGECPMCKQPADKFELVNPKREKLSGTMTVETVCSMAMQTMTQLI